MKGYHLVKIKNLIKNTDTRFKESFWKMSFSMSISTDILSHWDKKFCERLYYFWLSSLYRWNEIVILLEKKKKTKKKTELRLRSIIGKEDKIDKSTKQNEDKRYNIYFHFVFIKDLYLTKEILWKLIVFSLISAGLQKSATL